MQFFDMITALALGGILTILVLYVIVVYKKGWLRKDSRESKTHFLCPNPKCRKVFKEPIWLTDLSKTPPESYQSCPHCGANIQAAPSIIAKSSPQFESKPETHHVQKEIMSERAEFSSKPSSQTNTPSSEKLTSLQQQSQPKSWVQTFGPRKETPSEPTETPKKQDEKKPTDIPRSCVHYLGYVRTLPKNTPIPDECLWCPLIVRCLTGAEKVEA